MGHSHHPDGAHTHGTNSSNVLDALAQLVAVIALAVAGIDILLWVLHNMMIVVTTTIFSALLTTAGGCCIYKCSSIRTPPWPHVDPIPRPI